MFDLKFNMRLPRKIVDGAYYHVTQRFNRMELSFEEPGMKELFLDVLKEARSKYDFQFSNLCVMGNHVHLQIKPSGKGKNTLSRIMQWIFSVFAMRFNKLKGYLGHVWHGRFRSKVIETVHQFINTFFYIASNPVRAGLVDHPLEYAYNGVAIARNKRYQTLLDPPDNQWQLTRRKIDNFLRIFDLEKHMKINRELSFRRCQK